MWKLFGAAFGGVIVGFVGKMLYDEKGNILNPEFDDCVNPAPGENEFHVSSEELSNAKAQAEELDKMVKESKENK